MTIVVEPEQIAALIAHFDNTSEERRLLGQIEAEPTKHRAYPALLYGAFREALRLRFPDRYNVRDVVRLVADLRITTGDEAIDPTAAEILIRRALGDQRVREVPVSEQDRAIVQMQVLNYLVSTESLADNDIKELIMRAKAYVEESLA